MTCKLSTAPINISSGITSPGGDQTNISYDYGLASCSVTNYTTYLDINCFDGLNKVEYDDIGFLNVTGVRLYSPSLNSYDGFKADAELIITHSGQGKNCYICIPINNSQKEGSSANWFSQVIPYSPTGKNSAIPINVTNFSLNSVIPHASYYVYDKGTFDWGCNANDKMIIFHKNNAINMKNTDYKKLRQLIKPASYNINTTTEYITFNKKGTKEGPGVIAGNAAGKGMTCTPIVDQDGNSLEENEKQYSWTGSPPDDSTAKHAYNQTRYRYLWIILAVIGGILLITSLGYAFNYAFSKKTSSGSSLTNSSG